MISDIKLQTQQLVPDVGTDGVMEYPQMSKLGQLFTAGWKERLHLAGKLWVVTVGDFTAGCDIAPITGGGAGLSIDSDQPEVSIGIDAGYFLIPVEIMVSVNCDLDADQEVADIIAVADRSATNTVPTTKTVETPLNMLDGAGGAFPGRAYSAIQTDVTDITVDEILDAESVTYHFYTSGAGVSNLKMHYEPMIPSLLAGPCAMYIYWGGTAAVTGVARVVFGCVPSAYFPVA